MKTDFSCGVVPVRVVDGRREYLLVQHRAGHWSFPKGHPEEGESPIEAARRELAEETGLVGVAIEERPGFEEHYVFTKPSGVVVEKTVVYYVGRVGVDAVVTLQAEEVREFAWGGVEATGSRLTFDEGRALLDEVEGWLSGRADEPRP